MIDIIPQASGLDLGVVNTNVPRAGNLLSVQLGSLEYAQLFGIDLKYFLSEDVKFQNASFKAYLVETLANNSINVSSMVEVINNLYSDLKINLAPEENETGLVAR